MEEEKKLSPFVKGFKDLFDVLKNPEYKTAISTLKLAARLFVPHPMWKIAGDIVISGVCIVTVLYCAEHGYIEKSNIQSLITLIIGAIIGARFKNS